MIQAYQIHVEYIPGQRNVVADALSRRRFQSEVENELAEQILVISEDSCTWAAAQQQDERCAAIGSDLRNHPHYCMRDELLYFTGNEKLQLEVPQSKISAVLQAHHDHAFSGHMGAKKTWERVAKAHHWPAMRKDIARHCQECSQCARMKMQLNSGVHVHQGHVVDATLGPFSIINIDIVGPLQRTQHQKCAILVVVCVATRWAEAYPLPNVESSTVAQKLIEEIFCRYGAPSIIMSDRGTHFVNKLVEAVSLGLGSQHQLSQP